MDVIDETLPLVVQEHLRRGGVIENITLHAKGFWSHRGERFVHERLSEAFFRAVDRTDGGTWVLKIGRFTYPIQVEDTGFFVESISADETPRLRLSDGSEEVLDASTLVYGPEEGRLVASVKGGRFEARFLRQPYYELLLGAQEREDGTIWLSVAGREVRLG